MNSILPPPIELQLDALLLKDMNLFRWAHDYLGTKGPETSERPSPLEKLKFSDFITVSEDQILDEVRRRGLDSLVDHFAKEGEGTSIFQHGDLWVYSYTERGHSGILATAKSREEIEYEFVQKLILSAEVILNHRYKGAHP
ncbi:MAG: hypothetical protein HRT89_16390 [Lentisphaeria bacterium]|nr:hypothetical protein [Lentisphaeria bacterium]NQZ69639.1 hypothetical protein [Lentisphaeria bacterium]